jgi:hypothetical protein
MVDSTYARPLPAVLTAWFLSLGIDLFLHGALLARLYPPTGFALPADQAFRRIPLGRRLRRYPLNHIECRG